MKKISWLVQDKSTIIGYLSFMHSLRIHNPEPLSLVSRHHYRVTRSFSVHLGLSWKQTYLKQSQPRDIEARFDSVHFNSKFPFL